MDYREKIEERVKAQLLLRGFSNEYQLNHRGLISAIIDDTLLALTYINE